MQNESVLRFDETARIDSSRQSMLSRRFFLLARMTD